MWNEFRTVIGVAVYFVLQIMMEFYEGADV